VPCIVAGPDATGGGPTQNPVQIAGLDTLGNLQYVQTDTSGRIIPAAVSTATGDLAGTTFQTPNSGASGNPPVISQVFSYGYNPANNEFYRLRTDPGGRQLQGAYPTNAAVSLSSSGLTQIIAAGAGITTVSHLSVSLASATTFQLEYGTGSNCATGTTALSGVYQNVSAIALDVPFIVPSAKALCINLGASVTGGGIVVYAQP